VPVPERQPPTPARGTGTLHHLWPVIARRGCLGLARDERLAGGDDDGASAESAKSGRQLMILFAASQLTCTASKAETALVTSP
jgi:hypothetical protein